jgi:hypothetical protein
LAVDDAIGDARRLEGILLTAAAPDLNVSIYSPEHEG